MWNKLHYYTSNINCPITVLISYHVNMCGKHAKTTALSKKAGVCGYASFEEITEPDEDEEVLHLLNNKDASNTKKVTNTALKIFKEVVGLTFNYYCRFIMALNYLNKMHK